MTRKIAVLLLVAFLFPTTKGHCQESGKTFRIMFYNVENLFDTSDDPVTEDNEFLPGGMMRWSFKRYQNKISSLYKTIIAAGDWEPPSVAAFCEIENRKVLEDLINGTYLSKFRYKIIHEESPDRRGIDVCLIYRDPVRVIDYKYLIPRDISRKDFSSRSVLYARLRIIDDTIHFFVNHWPSRRGGVLANEQNRQSIALMIREKVDSIIESGKSGSKIIILGDFNCTPNDPVIKSFVSSNASGKAMIDLAGDLENEGIGSYRYMGSWELIDQVIISKDLLSIGEGIYTRPDLFRIFKPDFLMKKDPKYPGLSPYSTYRGYRYQGGFSDHLPVLLDLKVR